MHHVLRTSLGQRSPPPSHLFGGQSPVLGQGQVEDLFLLRAQTHLLGQEGGGALKRLRHLLALAAALEGQLAVLHAGPELDDPAVTPGRSS